MIPPRGILPRVLMRLFGLRPLVNASASRKLRQQHLVGARVALGEEPLAAAGTVEPPLALDPRDVVAEVVVGAQLARRRGRARSWVDLAPEAEVGHLARAAIGTGQDVGHGTVLTTFAS